jgi:hypothetical protein
MQALMRSIALGDKSVECFGHSLETEPGLFNKYAFVNSSWWRSTRCVPIFHSIVGTALHLISFGSREQSLLLHDQHESNTSFRSSPNRFRSLLQLLVHAQGSSPIIRTLGIDRLATRTLPHSCRAMTFVTTQSLCCHRLSSTLRSNSSTRHPTTATKDCWEGLRYDTVTVPTALRSDFHVFGTSGQALGDRLTTIWNKGHAPLSGAGNVRKLHLSYGIIDPINIFLVCSQGCTLHCFRSAHNRSRTKSSPPPSLWAPQQPVHHCSLAVKMACAVYLATHLLFKMIIPRCRSLPVSAGANDPRDRVSHYRSVSLARSRQSLRPIIPR